VHRADLHSAGSLAVAFNYERKMVAVLKCESDGIVAPYINFVGKG
jgi:hypothetical protein